MRTIHVSATSSVASLTQRPAKAGLVAIFAAAVTVAFGACQLSADQSQRAGDPPPPARVERPRAVRFHMDRHLDDLRTIAQRLLAGELADAKVLAILLTKPASDPGLQPWAADTAIVTKLAEELRAAPSVDEALRREARLAVACGDCHMRTQKVPLFAAWPPLPPDEPTRVARMHRHQWAADRLWEGVLAGDDRAWRAGLDVFVANPLPFEASLGPAPRLGVQLQMFAREASDRHVSGTETLDERGRLFGEMLVACASCHEASRAVPALH